MTVRRSGLILILLLAFAATAWAQVPNHASLLKAVRADYPARINQQQAGELLARVVWALKAEGFGLLRKDGGNRCPIPHASTTVSCDWILHRPTGLGCDSLTDTASATSLGTAGPNWCRTWEPMDMTKFVAPVDPGSPTPPVEPPAEGPTLVERLEQLSKDVAALATKLDAVGLKVDALATLPSKPLPTYDLSITVPFLGTARGTATPQEAPK